MELRRSRRLAGLTAEEGGSYYSVVADMDLEKKRRFSDVTDDLQIEGGSVFPVVLGLGLLVAMFLWAATVSASGA